MKIPWQWVVPCVMVFFLGITLGLLLSRQYNSWGYTIFGCFICTIAGLAGGAYIAEQQ